MSKPFKPMTKKQRKALRGALAAPIRQLWQTPADPIDILYEVAKLLGMVMLAAEIEAKLDDPAHALAIMMQVVTESRHQCREAGLAALELLHQHTEGQVH